VRLGEITDAELGDQILWVEPELLKQAGVLVGVDLLGQLLIGLLSVLLVTAGAQQLENLVLVDLHP
jgi:hypothetical protein